MGRFRLTIRLKVLLAFGVLARREAIRPIITVARPEGA